MAVLHLLALAALFSTCTAATYKSKLGRRFGGGKMFVVTDTTDGKKMPQVWMSNKGNMAQLDDVEAKCNALEGKYETAYIKNKVIYDYISVAMKSEVEQENKDYGIKNNSIDSDHFWVYSKFANNVYYWKKGETMNYKTIRSILFIEGQFVGYVDNSKFDYERDVKFGLVAVLRANITHLGYMPTDSDQKRRYMCTLTNILPPKPTSAPKPKPEKKPEEETGSRRGAPIARH